MSEKRKIGRGLKAVTFGNRTFVAAGEATVQSDSR